MVLNDATQEEGWQEAKRIILSYLDEGKSVVFLTLGDPMFYSTYMYVYRLIENTGHESKQFLALLLSVLLVLTLVTQL